MVEFKTCNLQNCQSQTISWDFSLSLQTNQNAMRYLHADYSHKTVILTIGKQVENDQLDSNEIYQEHFYLHSTKLNKY